MKEVIVRAQVRVGSGWRLYQKKSGFQALFASIKVFFLYKWM